MIWNVKGKIGSIACGAQTGSWEVLFDQEEIEIMSKAMQPHLRLANRSELVSKRIFDDFVGERELTGGRILELGPGQFDLVRLMASIGVEVVSIDHDPAVIALGKKRGYDVRQADFRTFEWSSLAGQFDMLVSRGSITPRWFKDPQPYGELIEGICSVLAPAGWGWMAPFHGSLDQDPSAYAEMMLSAERQAFEDNGFQGFDLPPKIAARYAVGLYPILYLKGIQLPNFGDAP